MDSTATQKVLGASNAGLFDQVLEFRTKSEEQLQPRQVRIAIAYSDVNPVDLQKLQSFKPKSNQVIFVPGFGGSGWITGVGLEVSKFQIGQRVCFLNSSNGGSYASSIAVDEHCVALLPERVELRDAAAIPVAGLTAYEVLNKIGLASKKKIDRKKGALTAVGLPSISDDEASPEKTLLIVGGAGGVGSWLVTLIKAWHPAWKVAITASTEIQQAYCTSILGADKALRHDEITQIFPGGCDGSVDAIVVLTEPSAPLFNACADIIKPFGHVALVVAGNAIRSLDLSFLFFKSVTVVCQTVFCSIRTNYRRIVPADELQVILDMLESQQIQVPLSPNLQDGTRSLSERFEDALKPNGILKALSEVHGKRGKLVLRIQGGDGVIFMDMKTSSLLEVDRQDCLKHKILTSNTNGKWRECTAHNSVEYKELVQKITTNPTLGIVKVVEKQVQDYQDGLDMQEAEGVKNLWGVELKKRTQNPRGEELIFLDPRDGSLGEVSRVSIFKSGIWQENEDGTIREALTDALELDGVAQRVRQILKLNLPEEAT